MWSSSEKVVKNKEQSHKDKNILNSPIRRLNICIIGVLEENQKNQKGNNELVAEICFFKSD